MQKLTTEEKNLIVDNIDWIRDRCWKWNKSIPQLSFEEIFSRACVRVCKDVKKFDPSKGSITTFFAAAIRFEMLSYIEDNKDEPPEISMSDLEYIDSEGSTYLSETLQKQLSSAPLDEKITLRETAEEISNLPERQEKVLKDSAFKGKTQEELASELSCRQPWISRLLQKARETLLDQK